MSNKEKILQYVKPSRTAEDIYWHSSDKEHVAFLSSEQFNALKHLDRIGSRLANYLTDKLEGEEPKGSGLIKDLWQLEETLNIVSRIKFATYEENESPVSRFFSETDRLYERNRESLINNKSDISFYNPPQLNSHLWKNHKGDNLLLGAFKGSEVRNLVNMRTSAAMMLKCVIDSLEGKPIKAKGLIGKLFNFRTIRDKLQRVCFLAVPEETDDVISECLIFWQHLDKDRI